MNSPETINRMAELFKRDVEEKEKELVYYYKWFFHKDMYELAWFIERYNTFDCDDFYFNNEYCQNYIKDFDLFCSIIERIAVMVEEDEGEFCFPVWKYYIEYHLYVYCLKFVTGQGTHKSLFKVERTCEMEGLKYPDNVIKLEEYFI